MRACTYTRQLCVVILAENWVEIGLIIAEILPFAKCDLDLLFKVSWCNAFVASLSCFILVKVLLISVIIADILIFINGDLYLHFQSQLIWQFCCRPHCHHFYENLVKIGHTITEIQQFLEMVTSIYIFKVRCEDIFIASRDAIIVV